MKKLLIKTGYCRYKKMKETLSSKLDEPYIRICLGRSEVDIIKAKRLDEVHQLINYIKTKRRANKYSKSFKFVQICMNFQDFLERKFSKYQPNNKNVNG